MKKQIIGLILVVAIILGGTAILALAMAASDRSVDKEVVTGPAVGNSPGIVHNIPVLKEPNVGALTGGSGAFLWVDSVSDQEYSEMMKILYPNGFFDEYGMDIAGVDDLEERRAAFVAEHTKAFVLNGTDAAEIESTPFKVKIASYSDGIYESLFYHARVGQDDFVYPSEWGAGQTCGFIADGEVGIYLVYTDIGIWRIDPMSLAVTRISTDTYMGKTRDEIREGMAYLYWIDGVALSPNGDFAVYRTNRDCSGNNTSVWAINLRTGEERQVIEPAYHNDIVGFLSDNNIVVGGSADTRIVNIITGSIVPVTFPQLPNFIICGVSGGTIIYSSYADGGSDTVAFISSIDALTGSMTLITRVTGFLGETRFSPSGKTVAIGYGTKPMVGVEDVMLVDLTKGTQKLLTASVRDANRIEGQIRRSEWAYNDMLIVTAQSETGWRTYVTAFGDL